jgi:hypothetical protein
MQYSEDFFPKERYAHVLTGDGRTERRILRAMCSKFDGRTLTLFFPSPPKSGGTGLRNLVKGAKLVMTGRQPLYALLLLDREFIGTPRLQDVCLEFGIRVDVMEDNESFTEADFVAGNQRAHVYMAISGTTRNIEEDVSTLIKEVRGDIVEGSKDEIRSYLNHHDMSLESLIEEANLGDLERAFVGLTRALHRIESTLG